ncbi:MAG: 3-isopropylmalate dehydratase small subunit, partial [Ruminococcus sp.]|nr:3-isopropylmalate dehydratase small subunit [Ruminococcus sp.]
IVECPEAVDGISEGDKVEADMDNGIIRNLTTGKEYKTAPFPEFVQKIIENGGLINSIAEGIIK